MLRRTLCSMLLFFARDCPSARARADHRASDAAGATRDIGSACRSDYVEGDHDDGRRDRRHWRFGYTSQLRATVEKTLSAGDDGRAWRPATPARRCTYSVGDRFNGAVQAAASRTPTSRSIWRSCAAAVATRHRVSTGRSASRRGVTQFSKFRDRATKTSLAPAYGELRLHVRLRRRLRLSDVAPIRARTSIRATISAASQDRARPCTQSDVPRLLTFRGGFRFGF